MKRKEIYSIIDKANNYLSMFDTADTLTQAENALIRAEECQSILTVLNIKSQLSDHKDEDIFDLLAQLELDIYSARIKFNIANTDTTALLKESFDAINEIKGSNVDEATLTAQLDITHTVENIESIITTLQVKRIRNKTDFEIYSNTIHSAV